MFYNVKINEKDASTFINHINLQENRQNEMKINITNLLDVIHDYLCNDVISIILEYASSEFVLCKYKVILLKPTNKYKRKKITFEITNKNNDFSFSYKSYVIYNDEKIMITMFTLIKPKFSFIGTDVLHGIMYAYLEDILSFMDNYFQTKYNIHYLRTYDTTKNINIILKSRRINYNTPYVIINNKPFQITGMDDDYKKYTEYLNILNENHLVMCADIIHYITNILIEKIEDK